MTANPITNQFLSSFFESFIITIFSELGDKTFMNITIMSMKYNPFVICLSATLSLATSSFVSSAVGSFLPNFLSNFYTTLISIFLYIYFGLSFLYESYEAFTNNKNPYNIPNSPSGTNISTNDEQNSPKSSVENFAFVETSDEISTQFLKVEHSNWLKVGTKCFIIIFLAEWGDRSQITTLAIAATKNWVGVGIGSSFAHFLCAIIAVLGGKILSGAISEKLLLSLSGTLSLFFAYSAYLEIA